MESELQRLNIPLAFTRLLHEALFASNAFTFFNEVSLYNAMFGRQPAMLPDFPVLDHEQETETSDHNREHIIRRISLEAITQATAVAKANRALRTKTTITGQHSYTVGDLVDYHRTTATKDDWGGWNGPYPVARNDPDRCQVIVKVGHRDVKVQYPMQDVHSTSRRLSHQKLVLTTQLCGL